MKKVLGLTLAALIGLVSAGSAWAHAIGIGDIVNGSSATIWMNSYHTNAGNEAGIILSGPSQAGSYAFNVDHANGAFLPGWTGYDAGPFYTNTSVDSQSITFNGLSAGVYNYVFTNTVGGNVTIDYSPQYGSYTKYNGTVTIVPEPGIVALFSLGLLGLGLRRIAKK